MAKIICIPPAIVDKLQSAIKEKKLDFDITKYSKLSFQQKSDFFDKIINNKAISNFIASEFTKSYNSRKKDAMTNWVKKTFYQKDNTVRNKFIKKIDEINEKLGDTIKKISAEPDAEKQSKQIQKELNLQDKIDKQLIEQIISEKLGISLSIEETKKITKLTDRINNMENYLNDPKTIIDAKKISESEKEKELKEALKNKEKLMELLDKKKGDKIFITDLVNAIMKLDDKNFNDYVIEYFKARKEIGDYIYSINPASIFERMLATAARGAMLLSVKSPLVNVAGNIITLADEAVPEFLLNYFKDIKTDPKLKQADFSNMGKYIKRALSVYKQSGYDITRMTSLAADEQTWAGEKKHAQLLGSDNIFLNLPKLLYDDITFKYLLGFPDVLSAAIHFSFNLSLNARNEAIKNGFKGDDIKKEANRLFKEAAAIHPNNNIDINAKNQDLITKSYQNNTAVKLRNNAVQAARVGTYTEERWASKLALKIRDAVSIPFEAAGIKGFGETFIPFTKIPANVAARIIDAQVGYLTKSVSNLVIGIKAAVQKNDIESHLRINAASKALLSAGFTTVAAIILSALMKPDDDDELQYTGSGVLTPSERKLKKELNVGYDSFRVNWFGKTAYISADYFGSLAGSMRTMAIINNGITSGEIINTIYKYSIDTVKTIQEIPGIKEFVWLFNDYQDKRDKVEEGKLEISDKAKVATKTAIDWVWVRTIPALINDIAIAQYPEQKRPDITDILDKPKTVVQWYTNNYNRKLDLFGEELEGKGWMFTFFGSRFNFETKNKYNAELNRLNKEGELPAIKDLEFINRRMKKLKQELTGDRFELLLRTIGQEFKKNVDEMFDSSDYTDGTPEEQSNLWRKAKNEAIKAGYEEIGIEIEESE